jgi:hypothetical protein
MVCVIYSLIDSSLASFFFFFLFFFFFGWSQYNYLIKGSGDAVTQGPAELEVVVSALRRELGVPEAACPYFKHLSALKKQVNNKNKKK